MQTHTSETKDAGFYAYAAMRDARMRNEAMKSTYTDAQRVRAERMRMGLACVYSSKEVHINYRKKFIAVKLSNAIVINRASVNDLERFSKDKQNVHTTAAVKRTVDVANKLISLTYTNQNSKNGLVEYLKKAKINQTNHLV